MATKKAKDKMWYWTKKQNTLEGQYVGAYGSIGKFHTPVFHIRDGATDRVQTIWGSTAIRRALVTAAPGSKVKIQYLGTRVLKGKMGKDGKPRKEFAFDIWLNGKKFQPAAMGTMARTGGHKRK